MGRYSRTVHELTLTPRLTGNCLLVLNLKIQFRDLHEKRLQTNVDELYIQPYNQQHNNKQQYPLLLFEVGLGGNTRSIRIVDMATPVTEISVFGALDFRINAQPVHLNISGTTQSLLQYLICHHRKLNRREKLMEMFWPGSDTERRRSSLNSAIWRIKKALQCCAPLRLDATSECVRLLGMEAETVHADFIEIEKIVTTLESSQQHSLAFLSQSLKTMLPCDDDPLDGLEDEWALVERERLENLRLRGLSMTMHHLEAEHEYEKAIEVGNKILQLDPFQEYTFQEMLCLYLLCGQRVKALQKYTAFEKMIKQELGIHPMIETRAIRDYVAGNAKLKAQLQLSKMGDVFQPGVCGLLLQLDTQKASALAIY